MDFSRIEIGDNLELKGGTTVLWKGNIEYVARKSKLIVRVLSIRGVASITKGYVIIGDGVISKGQKVDFVLAYARAIGNDAPESQILHRFNLPNI